MTSTRAPLRLTKEDGTEIAGTMGVADSLWTRFVGLMGRGELPPGEGLLIRPCSSIHMFFMRFAIDAVFVDGDGVIRRIYPSLKPWRMTWFVPKAKACLELPAGTCAAAGLVAGDSLRLVG